MNPKIETFKKAAGIDDNPDQEGLDLFAQMILEECIDIAQAGLAHAAVTVIKERFQIND
jgi:hypothetical protein